MLFFLNCKLYYLKFLRWIAIARLCRLLDIKGKEKEDYIRQLLARD